MTRISCLLCVLSLLIVLISEPVRGQYSQRPLGFAAFNTVPIDSVSDSSAKGKKKYPNPTSVALRSILPGWGQVVNRQAYKVPVIYAGFAVLGYFIKINNDHYQDFRMAYRLRTDGDPSTVDKYVRLYTDNGLLSAREYYRRNRDLNVIIAVGLYAANMIDAYVYAQLRDFDVSHDLSLRIEPVQILPNIAGSPAIGCGLTLKLR